MTFDMLIAWTLVDLGVAGVVGGLTLLVIRAIDRRWR